MSGNLKENIEAVKKRRIKVYHTLSFSLDQARSREEVTITGTYLYVLELDGTAFFQLNEGDADTLEFLKFRVIQAPFYRLYLTHSAQAGKNLKLAVGVEGDLFNIQDFQAPDLSLMSGYTKDVRDTLAYNGLYKYFGCGYGNQVVKSGDVSNNTIILHTVTAGKTLLIESFYHSIDSGVLVSELFITDAGDTQQFRLSKINSIAGVPVGYGVPCKIQAFEGWKVKLSAGPTHYGLAGIFGREF